MSMIPAAIPAIASLNRTIIGLKGHKTAKCHANDECLNRTIIGLKENILADIRLDKQ
jgi:hypothetical protein